MKSWSKNKLGKKHKILEFNENKSLKYLNLWDTIKEFLRDKCIALSNTNITYNSNIKKERTYINNLLPYLKDLKKYHDKGIDCEK